jgi:hypothetical protein
MRAVPGTQQQRGADGVKLAVLRKGPAILEFFRAAAHAHVGIGNGKHGPIGITICLRPPGDT